jgi:hypothetical protein
VATGVAVGVLGVVRAAAEVFAVATHTAPLGSPGRHHRRKAAAMAMAAASRVPAREMAGGEDPCAYASRDRGEERLRGLSGLGNHFGTDF